MYKYEIFDGLNKFITSGYEEDKDSALATCLDYIESTANNLNAYFSEGFYSIDSEYVNVYYVVDKEDYLYYVIMIIETL